MTKQRVSIGSLKNIAQYDDETDHPIRCSEDAEVDSVFGSDGMGGFRPTPKFWAWIRTIITSSKVRTLDGTIVKTDDGDPLWVGD